VTEGSQQVAATTVGGMRIPVGDDDVEPMIGEQCREVADHPIDREVRKCDVEVDLHHSGRGNQFVGVRAQLCFNTRFENNEAAVRWEETPLDVKAAVDFARSQPGITKVILFGHSGGGPLMSFYQVVAEKGPAYCQAPNRLVKCGSDLNGLKPADGPGVPMSTSCPA